jgi:hypothetical protein
MAACYVPTAYVPAETRAAAERMHNFACEDLRHPDVALRWFRPETAAEVQERLAWYGMPLEVLQRVPCFEMLLEEDASGSPLRILGSEDLGGLYVRFRPNEVWVYAGLSPDDAAHVAAHELHHAWQAGHYPEKLLGARLRTFYEGLSEAYAAHAAKRLSAIEGSLEEASV